MPGLVNLAFPTETPYLFLPPSSTGTRMKRPYMFDPLVKSHMTPKLHIVQRKLLLPCSPTSNCHAPLLLRVTGAF
jgi:hypothetical protein